MPLTFEFEQEYTLIGGTQYYFALNPGNATGNYVFCSRPQGEGYKIPDNTTTSMALGYQAGYLKPAGSKFPPWSIGMGGAGNEYPQIIINPQFVPEPIAYPLGLGGLALGAVLMRRIRRGRA